MSVEILNWIVLGGAGPIVVLLALMVRYRQLYLRAEKNRTRYQDTIDNLSEGYYRSSLDGRQLQANPSLVKLNGYDCEEDLLEGVKDIATEWYVDPNRRSEFRAILEAEGRVTDFVSEIYRHRTRERIWISENARLVRDESSGTPLYYEGSVREVTARVRKQQLERRLEKLASSVPGGLFQIVRHPDKTFSMPYLSIGFTRHTGVAEEDIRIDPARFLGIVHPDDLDGYLRSMQQSGRTLTDWIHEFRVRPQDGGDRWVLITATVEEEDDGSITWHGYITDISDRKKAEQQVRQLADFDALTGLPNRRLLSKRLDDALAASRREGGRGAVLFIDLDNFKHLNDTRGHDVGDRLLKGVAEALRHCVGSRGTVSRFGGDEFVLVVEALDRVPADAVRQVRSIAEEIVAAFDGGFDLGQFHHKTTSSVGVVLFDGTEDSSRDVIKRADIAMYEAKRSGRNRFVIHDAAETKRIADTFVLQEELKQAVERNELALELQPKVDAEGRIVGAEALVRWRHPDHGTILPADFIPMAEQTGMINAINDWVLTEGVRILERWKHEPGLSALGLSVNVSVQQFLKESFVDEMAMRLAENRIAPFKLTIELTERVVARNHTHVARCMEQLRAIGVRFALDDFGTGYSSLSLLKAFPFDEVKIDGAFVADVESDANARTLVEAILAMARALRLSAVAEHVDSEAKAEFLRDHGCALFQGHHFGRPVDVAEFEEMFASPSASGRIAS